MYRTAKAICLIGLALTLTGVALKLNHFAGAHITTNTGVVVLVSGLLLWALSLLRRKP